MAFRFVLAITDFSDMADHALTRAARLCAAHAAALALVHLAPPGTSPLPDAARRLAQHARLLSRHHGVPVRSIAGAAFNFAEVREAARHADLLVWGAAPLRGLRALFLGQPVERVLRMSQRPVLVVRQPAERDHAHMLIAVDFQAHAHRLAQMAHAMSPQASLELFHAISDATESKLRRTEISELAIHAYRDDCRRRAYLRLRALVDAAALKHDALHCSLGHGEAAHQIHLRQQQTGAELVVVGKHPAAWGSDRVFGSVAQCVLRAAKADVLIVPHDSQRAGCARAVERLTPGPVRPRLRPAAAAGQQPGTALGMAVPGMVPGFVSPGAHPVAAGNHSP